MEFRTEIWTKFWDSSVYAGLRQFHRGKGFEPDSQDVAQNLGYPLYELSDQINPSFAHVDGEHFSEGEPVIKHESENTQTISTVQASSGEQDAKRSDLRESIPVSLTFAFVMNLQLALMLFLSFAWLYDQGWESVRLS
ncbi:hypothetical protein B0H19DRAFT_1275952 [Mycena capillaripes]|nr:hypothetical protein B0H19DRAFT_1275952 [Mycena capillaripes]